MSLAARIRVDEQMDDPGLAPETYDRVLKDLARVNAVTLGDAADAELPRPRHEGHDRLPPARRRLRPWRHAAPDRALGEEAGLRRRPDRRRSQPAQRCRGAGGDADPLADRISHRRLSRRRRAARHRRLQPRRPSYDRRRAGRLPALHGGARRRGAGSSTICTGSLSLITAFRCSPVCSARTGSCARTARSRSAAPSAPPTGRRSSPARASPGARIVRRFPFRLCVERLR